LASSAETSPDPGTGIRNCLGGAIARRDFSSNRSGGKTKGKRARKRRSFPVRYPFCREEGRVRRLTAQALGAAGLLAIFVANAKAQNGNAPSDAVLGAITARGRLLADYDQAAWHATDAVETANPKTVEGQHYLAKKENGKWRVVFGALSADKSKFLISYDATEKAKAREFSVQQHAPPNEDRGGYLFAARALELALADFGPASRPYNVAVLPAKTLESNGQDGLFVYLYPGQTKAGIYPLGGDARYLVSADGTKILEKRRLHKSVIENQPPKGKKVEGGFHTHVLSDLPEDTDVLHVLQQDPPLPEFVSTPHYLFEIAANGTIQIKKNRR
jgi:hypothetical protein